MKITHTTTRRILSSKNEAVIYNNVLTARKPYMLSSAANILSTSSPDVSFMPAVDANIHTTQRVFSSKNTAGTHNNMLTARKLYMLPFAANIYSTSSPDVSFMPAIDANIYTITQRVLSSKNAAGTHNNVLITNTLCMLFFAAKTAAITHNTIRRVLSSKNASTTHNTQISFSKMGSDYNE